MFNLPQINEEDVRVVDAAAAELIARTEASAVLVTDVGGALIVQRGDIEGFDITSIAALASNSYAATQMIASLINEPNFTAVTQQGDNWGLLVMNVEEYCILVVIFRASVSVGLIKYYAQDTVKAMAAQMKIASERAPGATLDMVEMNVGGIEEVFKRKRESADQPAEPAVPAEPVICQRVPLVEVAYPGDYMYCACGRSKTQPFCDGSHAGTGIEPIPIQIKEAGQVAWCLCKHSKTKPFCDGSHSRL